MRRQLSAVLSVVVLLATSCSSLADVELAAASVPRASTTPQDASAAADAVNAFALDLFARLAADDGNLVVSPASIALALAQARAGARGATAAEMDRVLHDAASDAHAAWLNALDRALSERTGSFKDESGKTQQVVLRIANSAFSQRGMTLKPAFLEALSSRFGAGVRLVDYVRETEKARRQINAWVDSKTEHRIRELLVPGILTTMTRLTLVNAIYLKAAWLHPFLEDATAAAVFTRADGSTVSVPMMNGTEELRYARGDGWTAVDLPYVGEELALTLVIPDDLAAFEPALTLDRLNAMTRALEPRSVTLAMPKFGIETKTQLAELLSALGMPTAFLPGQADFSGITDDEELVISDVIHQANIDVDEKGTEAAAATAVVMRATAMPAEPVVVRADRPFLFLLRDVPTGSVLFIGRVADPSIGR